MDVTARREMWDMLKKYKNDRIIILTTHYMEEADNLGDRIGIMSHGQMVCCGTADFLKNKFGEGYNLIVVKAEREDNVRLEEFITSNVPNAKKVSEVSSEATYLLPKDSADSFGEFFKRLDQQSKDLGVESYGVSMTTLEEVFLQVEGDLQEDDKLKVENIKRRLTSNLEDNKNELNADNYSIAKEQISGSFTVFMLHFGALFMKRLLLSKRNFKAFLIELLIPGMLVIAGFGVSTINFFIDSDERILEPDLFPLEQRIIYNTNGISGGSDPETLIDLLEPSSAFSPTGVSSTIGSTYLETLENFDDILYDAAQEDPLKPFRFGSYYFKELDYKYNQYKIVTFVNITSQEAAVAYPQFMYEAVLKSVSGPDFQYTMVNDPMPIVQIFKDRDQGGNGLFLCFILGIAYALIPTSIIGYIMNEKVNALIHQQIISGMGKISYWTANYVYDVLKTFVVIIISIIFLYAFNLNLEYGWLLLLLFPTAIVAHTYASSFIFREEANAQTFTILYHFFFGSLLPILITVLRFINSTKEVGDMMLWPFRIIPTFNV